MEVSTFIWMFVVLKIPVIAALLVIWWAISEPEPTADEDDADGRGGSDRAPDPSRPRRPRPPRRGPHAAPPPAAPSRVRTASGRRRSRASR